MWWSNSPLALFQSTALLAQSASSNSVAGHFVISSPGIPEIELLTHTVDMQLQYSPANTGDLTIPQLQPEQLTLLVQISYRFHNVGDDGRTARVTISPSPSLSSASVSPRAGSATSPVTVQVDNQAVALQAASDGTSTFQLSLTPDQRSVVRLNYSISLGGTGLPTIVYPVAWIDSWASAMSLRVNIRTHNAVPPESWTILLPDGWNYALTNDIQQPDIKWLYDAATPESAIQMQFVHPLLWQALQENIAISVSSPGAASYLSVGNSYKRLYMAATAIQTSRVEGLSPADMDSVADLYYAQAVAAYTEGIRSGQAANDAPSALGQLHAQLASLYRNNIIAKGEIGTQYAALTVQEAANALARLPAESRLGPELRQWQIEGLYSLLQNARQREMWDESLSYIERLMPLVETSPTSVINVQRLSEIERIIIIQEALDVLEGGNQGAAIALAGPEIANADLQPASEEQSLFRQWQLEATIRPAQTVLGIKALTDGEQLQQAQNGLSGLIGTWQRNGLVEIEEAIAVKRYQPSAAAPDDTAPTRGEGSNISQDTQESSQAYVLTAKLSIDHTQPRDALLQPLPNDANWALLRELLKQLSPQVERAGSPFMEDLTIQMNLDLRAAGDHWDTMAAKLRRDAEAARSESANTEKSIATGTSSSAGMESANAALTARIRAVNFANEANVWQDLAQNSWILVRMEANPRIATNGIGNTAMTETVSSDGASSDAANRGSAVSRSWIATVETPPQNLQIEAASLAPGRIALLITLVIIGLFIVSGLLWWLL